MKNLIKNALLIVVLFTVSVSIANVNPNPKNIVNIVDTKRIHLNLTYFEGNVAVQIKDSYGEILYNSNYNKINSAKKYDLSLLPVGNYTIELESETKIKMIPFSVNEEKIVLNEEKQTVYFKPSILVRGDLVYISKHAQAKEAMKILVYDKDSNLIYDENLRGSGNFGRILNVSKLLSGNYSIVVENDGKQLIKTINK